ncbi:MAG: GxxExxY protein [Chthoniobacterales bacterium]
MGKTAEDSENTEGEKTGIIIGAAIRVLEQLKPGLDEKLYENALVIELAKQGMQPQQQKAGATRTCAAHQLVHNSVPPHLCCLGRATITLASFTGCHIDTHTVGGCFSVACRPLS